MIISRIEGGLGNQMFQYAYASYLADRLQTALLLDTRSYAAGPQHGYLLDQFCIEATIADNRLLARLPRKYRPTADSLGFANWLLPAWLRRHKESPFGFHTKYLRSLDNRYVVGYWQSEKFFPGLRPRLIEQFQSRGPLSDVSRRVAEQIDSTQSITLHIRRGDYLSDPQASKIYAQLDWNYYLESLHEWAADRSGVEVFVFSNDMQWCRENIRLPWPVHFVAHNTAATAHEDMLLMSRAACNVIANSTFSWWSAWLNERPGRSVYAPPSWFKPGTLDDSSIVPEDWKRGLQERGQESKVQSTRRAVPAFDS